MERPYVTETEAGFFARAGEYVIGGALALIGWIMSTFTKRHLEAMDKLASRMECIGIDVSHMKSDIRSLRESQERNEERFEALEERDHR